MLKDTLLYLAQNQQMRNFVVQNSLARKISHRFVAGETLDDAVEAARGLNKRGIQVALDLLGENVADEEEARLSTQNYIAAVERIKQTGIDANISVKLTALGLDISQDLCAQNLRTILECARQYSIFVCMDMEGSAYTERTVDMTLRAHEQFEQIGTVIQSYLFRSRKDVEQLVQNGVRLRLVKGAYKESPTIAYQNKNDVDRNYIRLITMLLAQGNFPAIATHDQTMIDAARHYMRDHGISKEAFEFQMLYGIRRDLQEQLVQKGYNVRVYVPYGAQWYPYLMRRMAERPANLMFVVSNSMR
ncbi:MAG TPA: proline dehydrogenase family protein [Ktedonobacteraceae bacterium]|jgi:proline dehydrogenase|nr:proline dehydrogenase family protein [Ktedonobacteraceae bacterium]